MTRDIPLADEDINREIRNYERQIKAIQYEVRILKRELKLRIKVRSQIQGKDGD